MRLMRPFILFIIFMSIISPVAFADDNGLLAPANNSGEGFTVLSAYNVDVQPAPGYPESNSGMDRLSSFWELPLWVQITYLSIITASLIAILKAMPFLSGRLKHALENKKTKDIFYHIQNNPGLTIQQLSDEQNINRGTLKYHLSQLFLNNKILFIRKGKVSQLYHKTLSPMDKESVIGSYMRKNDNSKAILFTIMDKPGVTNKDLSEKLGLDKSTITDYLKNFLSDGIVEFRQDGKLKRCYVKQDARMVMLRYRPQ